MQEDDDIVELELWEEDDEPAIEHRVSLLTRVVHHPRLTAGSGALLVSFGIDLATRFDTTAVVLTLAASLMIGIKGDELLQSMIPGADQQAVRESAEHFADHLLGDDYPIYADQSVGAKLKRLFGRDRNPPLAMPKTERSNTVGKRERKAGLTLDRVLDLIEDGKLTDAQFFALLERLPDTIDADDYEDDDRDEDGATHAQNTASNEPVETPQDRKSTVRQYRLDAKQIAQFCALYPVHVANKDDALREVGANTAYRAHANEIIEEYKLLEKKKG